MITSGSNQKLKKVRKLLSSASERRKTGLFVVEGMRLFSETPVELIEETLFSDQLTGIDLSAYPKAEMVEHTVFKSLSDTVHPQGILAVVRQPEWKKPAFLECRTEIHTGKVRQVDEPDCHVCAAVHSEKTESAFSTASLCERIDTTSVQSQKTVKNVRSEEAKKAVFSDSENHPEVLAPGKKLLLLDGVRDPGNLGTMIRTAEAAGAAAVCMSPDCVDLYNPKVIRSTMGSIFRVPVFCGDLLVVIRTLQQNGVPVYASSLEASRSFRDVDLDGAGIVIGNEANGISKEVLSAATGCIHIPMAGQVESLNAAVSAAVLLFS